MRVLIAILSCYTQTEQDDVCRDTWLRGCGAEYRFFVGAGRPQYSDVQALAVADDYVSLPFKTQAICRWALAAGYDYMFKCDNDTYVHVPRLLASGFEQFPYSGYDWYGNGGYCSGGAGYWLSRKAMQIIAAADLMLDYGDETRRSIKGEDLQIGEALRARGIQPHGDTRYRIRVPGPCRDNDAITLHDVCMPCKGAHMRAVHEAASL